MLAIGVGLAVWPTTFTLVPMGVVLIAIGVTKWIRSIIWAHSLSFALTNGVACVP